RHSNRLQRSYDFGATILKPGGQVELGSQLLLGFVFFERTRSVAAALHQNSAGATAVHRIEIEPVFDLGGIRVAELFINRLLLGKRVLIGSPQRNVVHRARAEGPASRQTIRLVQEGNGL